MKPKITLIAILTLTLVLAGCKEKSRTTPAQAAQPAEQTAPTEELPPTPQEMPGEIRADVPRPENAPSTPEMVTVIGAGEERRLTDFAGTEGEQTLGGYQIARFEVTQELYAAVTGENPSYYKNGAAEGEKQEKRPVEWVSWYDAVAFCNRLSSLSSLTPCYTVDGERDPSKWNYTPHEGASIGGTVECDAEADGYRLPTEAEWEFAARGGDAGGWDYKYAGSDDIDEVAWYYSNSGDKTHEVGKKEANALGLYDMSGNAWEWCDSLYSLSGSYRVGRGGSFNYNDYYCRVGDRDYAHPSGRDDYLGFRLVRSVRNAAPESAGQTAQAARGYKVGDIVLSDGSTVSAENAAAMSDAQKAKAVAVIFYAGSEGDPLGKRTLGVGLRNTGEENALQWARGFSASDCAEGGVKDIAAIQCIPSRHKKGAPEPALRATFTGDLDGSDNWKALCDAVSDEDTTGNYPAWEWVNAYAESNSLTGIYADGWYLPTVAELSMLYRVKDTVNASLESAGGMKIADEDREYWSSSQSSIGKDYAWYIHISKDAGFLINDPKNNFMGVCCIRAF